MNRRATCAGNCLAPRTRKMRSHNECATSPPYPSGVHPTDQWPARSPLNGRLWGRNGAGYVRWHGNGAGTARGHGARAGAGGGCHAGAGAVGRRLDQRVAGARRRNVAALGATSKGLLALMQGHVRKHRCHRSHPLSMGGGFQVVGFSNSFLRQSCSTRSGTRRVSPCREETDVHKANVYGAQGLDSHTKLIAGRSEGHE